MPVRDVRVGGGLAGDVPDDAGRAGVDDHHSRGLARMKMVTTPRAGPNEEEHQFAKAIM